MESTTAHNYRAYFDALPAERQSEPLWEQPEFKADLSYNPAPGREKILTFGDGSVFDYYDRWAFSSTAWANRDRSIDLRSSD